MLTESFVTSVRAQQTIKNTAVSKDVGIYMHTLNPSHTVKSSFKKSSTAPNGLAATSTHVFAAQVDKAVVHVYSKEKSNQEALVSFPERIHSLTAIGEHVVVVGTAEGRIIVWEVSPVQRSLFFYHTHQIIDMYRPTGIDTGSSFAAYFLHRQYAKSPYHRVRRLEHTCLVVTKTSFHHHN